MKYRQLTKEQFEELHEEFASFLATLQIDVKEWKHIKKSKPEMAEEKLNIFSDVVWDDVLTKTQYLEHISNHHINLFKCNSLEIIRIYIQWSDTDRNFLNSEDFNWFRSNPLDDQITYYKASKKYHKSRNEELFELIEMGSQISRGELFKAIVTLIH